MLLVQHQTILSIAGHPIQSACSHQGIAHIVQQKLCAALKCNESRVNVVQA